MTSFDDATSIMHFLKSELLRPGLFVTYLWRKRRTGNVNAENRKQGNGKQKTANVITENRKQKTGNRERNCRKHKTMNRTGNRNVETETGDRKHTR